MQNCLEVTFLQCGIAWRRPAGTRDTLGGKSKCTQYFGLGNSINETHFESFAAGRKII
jgi:hypothetical protein